MPKSIDYTKIARQLEDNLPVDLDSREKRLLHAAWNSKVSNNFDVDAAFSKMEKKMESGSPKVLKMKIWYAAAAVVLLALTFGVYQYLSPVVYQTIPGEQMSIILADETEVVLQGGSKLIIKRSFGETNRELTFQGKAKFEVSKNKDLPFIIASSKGKATVLGTEFIYMDYPKTDLLSLEVQEGKVSFENDNSKEVLSKGDAIYVSKGEIVRSKVTSEVGKYNFKMASIEDIVNVLEQSYGVNIVYNQKVAKQQLNLGFSARLKIQEILEILTKTTDCKFSVKQK